MPSNQTANYALSQWERTDKVQMEDFNADNAKIDAALKAEADARTALAGQLSGKGNCRIVYTTYTGTGQYGEAAPNVLSFPGPPLAVLIGDGGNNGITLVAVRGQATTFAQSHAYFLNWLTWNGNTLSWYHHQSEPGQMNSLGVSYFVVALIAADE